MPNWVSHALTVSGPKAELSRFVDECFCIAENGEPQFDFNKLVPMPIEIKCGKDCGGRRQDGNSLFPDWYEWSCENWGTKWNACSTDVVPPKKGVHKIKLFFRTAWSIPWPIFEELAARFTNLTIEGDIVDEFLEFAGHIQCSGGKIEYDDQTEPRRKGFLARLDEEQTGLDAAGAASCNTDPPF